MTAKPDETPQVLPAQPTRNRPTPARPADAASGPEPARLPPSPPPVAGEERPGWPKEVGGPKGLEPTRYGDWEYNGRCTDF